MNNLTIEYYKRFLVLFTLVVSFIFLVYTIDYTNSIAKSLIKFFDNITLSSDYKSTKYNVSPENTSLKYTNKKSKDQKQKDKFFDKEYEIQIKGIDY